MQASVEVFIIKLGMLLQPFEVSYKEHLEWVTWSCLKMLWEKVDKFKLWMKVNNVDLKQPREKDQWLMSQLKEAGYGLDELKRLN